MTCCFLLVTRGHFCYSPGFFSIATSAEAKVSQYWEPPAKQTNKKPGFLEMKLTQFRSFRNRTSQRKAVCFRSLSIVLQIIVRFRLYDSHFLTQHAVSFLFCVCWLAYFCRCKRRIHSPVFLNNVPQVHRATWEFCSWTLTGRDLIVF